MDGPSSTDIFLFEGFRLDRRSGILCRRDERGVFAPLTIGSRALDILGVLVDRPGELVSRDEIMEAVWPGTVVEDSNLNVQVAALRRVLDQDRELGSCIQTVSGRGYRLVVPVTPVEPATPQSGNSSGGPVAEAPAHLTVAPRLSIVVLPFTNLSDDREQQYFADGITDDLTTDLSRLANMFVISRNTAFTYRNKPVDTRQIGRELGVRYVLEGSVRRSGNQLRINAQLIDAATDTHLWAERFDRDTGDLFALQDEVTSQIAVALNIELVGVAAARPTEDPDALDYVLRGRAAISKPLTRDNLAEAIGLFERALAADPGSVEAQSRLAIALADRVLNFGSSMRDGEFRRAEQLAIRALAASPRSALPHFAKAQVLRVQGRHEEAISEYETVLVFNRNSVHAIADSGRCKVFIGQIDEAIPAQERAIRLSPRDPGIGFWYFRIGQAHLLQSRIEKAILWFEKARGANPEILDFRAYLASGYALQGDTGRAAAELFEARRLDREGRYSSIACARFWDSLSQNRGARPEIRARFEATYFAGLRKAGVPEE